MIIEKELQAEIIAHFSERWFVISGYSYDLLPPAPNHFWVKVPHLENSDLFFLQSLSGRYAYPVSGNERITIQVAPAAQNLIKISFY